MTRTSLKRRHEKQECSSFPLQKKAKGLFSQNEINNIVKQADIDFKSAQVIVSKLKNKGHTDKSVKVTAFRKCTVKEFGKFYVQKGEGNQAYVVCTDVKGLVYALDSQFDPKDWRLFADRTSKNFIVALIHNLNKKPSIPLVFSRDKSENNDRMSQIWEDLQYLLKISV